MLEYLRNASERPVAKILMGILIFSFVGWGAAEWIFGNVASHNTLAQVGDAEISMDQFNSEKSRQISMMPKAEQKQLYKDKVLMNDFNNQILYNLSNRTLIKNRSSDLGFAVNDKQIIKDIRGDKRFYEKGEFRPGRFDEVLANSGLMEEDYANIVRDDIQAAMIYDNLSVPVRVPEFVVNAAYNARYAKKTIKYASVPYSDFQIKEKPTDENLREFYAKNPKIIPEHRKVAYVLMPADMSKPDEYDRGYLATQKLEDDIISGDFLSAAAKKHNAKYVELKAFPADKRPVDSLLSDSVILKIFNSEEGMESEMIETKKGFVIFRVQQIIPQHSEKFEAVKGKLVSGWMRDEQKKKAYMRANELLVKLNKTGNLESGKKVNVSRTDGAPMDVLVSSFANPVGINTIVPSSDRFYVLNIVKEIAPQKDKAKLKSLRKELNSLNKKALREDYNSFLYREYPLEVNDKLFNKMFIK